MRLPWRAPRPPVPEAAGPQPSHVAPPAPGPRFGHDYGGIEYTVRVWQCGCIHLFGDRGQLTGCTPCQPVDDELRGLLS